MSPDDVRHGTSAGYVAGCRERCCKTAAADWMRHYRTRLYILGDLTVPATATKRRIRALMALGWSTVQIDECIGRGRTYTSNLLCGQDRVLLATAEMYAAVYSEMSMQAPPTTTRYERQRVTRLRNLAARNQWPPPLAWDNIDDPEESPTDWQYVPATRAETFAELVESQASVSEACRRLDLSPGALEKWADRAGLRPEFNAMNARERAVFEQRNQWSA